MQGKKIIHVINSVGIGGAEILLLNTTRHLEQFEQTVVAVDRVIQPLDFPPSVRIVELKCAGWAQLPRAVARLKKIIGEINPDLVHSHLFYSSLISKLATPGSVPLVISLHNEMSKDLYFNRWYSFYNLILDRLTFRKTDTIIGVSKLVVEDFRKHIKMPLDNYVLYNFIDDAFLGREKLSYSEKRPLRLASVGNLRDQKNYGFLLDTLKQYPHLPVEVDIYGSGLLKEELEQTIQLNQLPAHLKGHIGKVYEVLPGYDAFIMTSKYEGFCIAVVEAMAIGLPLILPDLPIFLEVTENNAFFYSQGNQRSLFDAVSKFANTPLEKLKEMTRDNLNLVKKKYSSQSFKEQLQAIYFDILKKNRPG